MSDPKSSPNDRIIESVKQLSSGWKNTDFSKRPPEKVGSGKLYTVVFKGEDGLWRENYVFEKGSDIRPYSNIRDVLRDTSNGIIPSWKDQDFVKLIVISILTGIFSISVIGIVILNPDNKSLQVLIGLLGLTLGYLVGKGDKSN